MTTMKCPTCGRDFKHDKSGNCVGCGAYIRGHYIGVYKGKPVTFSEAAELSDRPEYLKMLDMKYYHANLSY